MFFLDLEFPVPEDYFGVIGVQRPLEDRRTRSYPEIHPSKCHDRTKRLPPLPPRPVKCKPKEEKKIVFFGSNVTKQRSESFDEENLEKEKSKRKKKRNVFIQQLQR